MDHQRLANDISVGKRLLIAVLIAAVVTLPFWLTHEEPVTGPVTFADESRQVGDVVAVKCPFRMPRQNNAQCYRAYAPQDWTAYQAGGDGGPLISILALVLTPANGASELDPFVYLEGGPGFAGVPAEYNDFGADGWLRWAYEPVLETGRAMIFVDTRGLGYSEPALHCPAALRAAWQDLKRKPLERDLGSTVFDADTACFRALEAQGVDLAAYQSDYAARDLALLRRGLGIDQWNLYGISYGAQTALNLLNVDEEGVRSVIFDSPSYDRVSVFPDDQAAFDRVLDQVEMRCATGGDLVNCGEGIKAKLVALQAQLREKPIPVRGQPFGSAVYMGDREVMLVVHDALYQADGQERVLRIIEALSDQSANYISSLSNWAMDWHQTLYWSYLNEAFSWPVHLTTTCRENDHGPSSGASEW
ncbi:MAG: alpha/beta fold hydrolase, partial [Aquisalinus sp.]|nr:alpha/beta fold hydrolase [Aquisalinus sp.]